MKGDLASLTAPRLLQGNMQEADPTATAVPTLPEVPSLPVDLVVSPPCMSSRMPLISLALP